MVSKKSGMDSKSAPADLISGSRFLNHVNNTLVTNKHYREEHPSNLPVYQKDYIINHCANIWNKTGQHWITDNKDLLNNIIINLN